jgi:NAD(P)-dependent dehydrogenase (short-subunit alcohol dehydrogenase family)
MPLVDDVFLSREAEVPQCSFPPVRSSRTRMSNWVSREAAAAKAALNACSKSLALACGPRGVRVTAVMPGVIETDAVEASLRDAAERTGRDLDVIRAEFRRRLAAPLGRPGRAEEAAELVAFLASPRASYLTGVAISVDATL